MFDQQLASRKKDFQTRSLTPYRIFSRLVHNLHWQAKGFFMSNVKPQPFSKRNEGIRSQLYITPSTIFLITQLTPPIGTIIDQQVALLLKVEM